MKLQTFLLYANTLSLVQLVHSFSRQSPFLFRTPVNHYSTTMFVSKETLDGAQAMIDAIIDEKNCNPLFVRLAWHDSGTYDDSLKDQEWPKAGGAIGSIRFKPEIQHGANAGLASAVELLEPVKAKFPDMSYSDIFQMASARSIELAGGPKIDMK
jgi:L-ascorbate peroxidase